MALSRPTIIKLGRTLFAAACLLLLCRYMWVNREDFSTLRNVRPDYIACILMAHSVSLLLAAARFRAVLKHVGTRIAFWPWFRILVISRFMSKLVPQAGNVYRITILKMRYNLSITKYVSVFATLSMFDHVLHLLIALLIVLFLEPSLQFQGQPVWLILLGFLVLIVAAPFFLEKILSPLGGRVQVLECAHKRLLQVLGTVRENQTNYALLLDYGVFATLYFLIGLSAIYCCFACAGVFPSLPYLVIFWAIVSLTQLINLTPGNIGIVEFIYAWLSYEAGFGAAEGILAALILRVLSYINLMAWGIILGGLPLFFKYRGQCEDRAALNVTRHDGRGENRGS